MKKESIRILVSTGHLGTAPSKKESFFLGMKSRPDVIVADGGSSDPGPVYLGEDIRLGMFVREELELMLTASRKQGIPYIVGSAGDSGSNNGVDEFVGIIKSLALEHHLPKFKIGYFYSEVDKNFLKAKFKADEIPAGLDGFPPLTIEDLEQSTRIVAMAGIHPYIQLLNQGADVIIGGRSGDIAAIAAPAIRAGFPESLSYHNGKMIECASFCAEPYMGKKQSLVPYPMTTSRLLPVTLTKDVRSPPFVAIPCMNGRHHLMSMLLAECWTCRHAIMNSLMKNLPV